ncbi:MAG: sensor histidine kinase, partial [Alphaproteobacteria bacterium]|nr:sensor histidine kinase [Alphaproteobacteria bacterium]
WSEEEYRIFGTSPDNFRPNFETFLAFVHPDDRARMISANDASLNGVPMSFEHRIVRSDGEVRYVHEHAQVLITGDHGGHPILVGTTQDITEHRRAEETIALQTVEMREMQATLNFLSRQRAMGTMAAALAHEINQPLTAIASYASGLRRMLGEIDRTSAILEGLAAIEANALRAGEIIRRMRMVAREGSVNKEQVDLDSLFADSVRLACAGRRDVSLEFERGSAKTVWADRIQLEQVLTNLIKNACEAVAEADTKKITISTCEDAQHVRICIADTGPGISSDNDLFEATISSKPAGMGIGLAICRTIVEAHGGRIWAQGLERGACFCFNLPKAEAFG